MREILFRGKRIDNGKWAYGVPLIGKTSGVFMVWIESESKLVRGVISIRDVVKQAEVIPETVGQYTGLKDTNGQRIFEGDIVTAQHDFYETKSIGCIESGTLEVWDEYQDGINETGEVKFECAAFVIKEWDIGIFESEELEVIGNATDNPELMGETK